MHPGNSFLQPLIWSLGSIICRYIGLVIGKRKEAQGLGIEAGTEHACWKLIIFGLVVIAFATTHGSQKGVQFAPKWSDHIFSGTYRQHLPSL